MTTPLVKQIAKAVKGALIQAKAVEAAALVRVTSGARTPGNLAGGTNPSETSIPCQAFDSDAQHDKIGGTTVDQSHRVIGVVGLGEIEPTSNDKIRIGGVTLRIVDLQGNPALWTCLCQQ